MKTGTNPIVFLLKTPFIDASTLGIFLGNGPYKVKKAPCYALTTPVLITFF